MKGGDLDRIREAFSGQGASRKVTPEIENYVRDRFRDLYGQRRDYSKVIRAEVEKYFSVSVCAERLRWIFREEREKLAANPEDDAEGVVMNGADPVAKSAEEEGCGANSCERARKSTRLNSSHIPLPRLPSSA